MVPMKLEVAVDFRNWLEDVLTMRDAEVYVLLVKQVISIFELIHQYYAKLDGTLDIQFLPTLSSTCHLLLCTIHLKCFCSFGNFIFCVWSDTYHILWLGKVDTEARISRKFPAGELHTYLSLPSVFSLGGNWEK